MLKNFFGKPKSPRLESFLQTKPVLWLLSLLNWPRKMIRKLYAWVIGWAGKPQAEKALAGIAFAESSFFPIPPDPLLIAMTTARPNRYIRFAVICTAGSVIGGIVGYLIGVGLFEVIGHHIINAYHLHEEFAIIEERYAANAFLAIFTAAFTPIPYKLITIAAGVFHVHLLVFIAASIIGRGARFFLVALLMHHFGKRFKDKIEKYIDILSLIFVALIIAGIWMLKFL